MTMFNAWNSVQRVLDHLAEHGVPNVNVEIAMLTSEWLDENPINPEWDREPAEAMAAKIHRYFNSKRPTNLGWTHTIYRYGHLPIIHGGIISDRCLLLGVSRWVDGCLKAGQKPYEVHRAEDGDYARDRINVYNDWFRFCSTERENWYHQNLESRKTSPRATLANCDQDSRENKGFHTTMLKPFSLLLVFAAILFFVVSVPAQAPSTPSRANLLRGEYGRYRANNDLLYYRLDVRVDPDKKHISGSTQMRFKMLQDDNRIQLDLSDTLKVEKIVFDPTNLFGPNGIQRKGLRKRETVVEPVLLKYERDSGALFVDFPEMLKTGRTYTVYVYYEGTPPETGRFGGIAFRKDPQGRHWINTACQGEGASIWWPNKDQWRDEVESMHISVSIPNDLVDVSNGRFIGKTDLGNGYTRWDWLVQYPINNYNVSLNIGKYEHFADKMGDLTLDFYALPENLEKAKRQFSQTKGMMQAFQHYFGEYPFKKDGFKLIEVPYSGMEHQSAVTYGNRFANGYLERDWTGVGISPKFDFIIIHESAHEWFGNSISATDLSEMWIHEGWTTYLECLYVEYHFGKADGLKYTNGYKAKVQNRRPIISQHGVNATPPQDQYFKGALFLNTLRSVIDDDKRWFALIREFYQTFKYKNITTEEIVAFFNRKSGKDLTPVFKQYLRHAALPVLELKFSEDSISYRWKADEKSFAMPVKVGTKTKWQLIQPTTEWQTMKTSLSKDEFEVATDLYYVDVSKF